MPKIYTERETTELYNSTGEPAIAKYSENVKQYGRQMDADAQRYENQAKQTYSTALKISASDTMNQLYQQYPDDPVALKDAFKKAYDKSIGDIVDDDVKVDFMANVTLQSQSYITKAIDNKQKKDYRIMKSTTFDGIDKNTQTLGLAFSTLLGDDFNPDNVGVYNIALSNNKAMIDTLNPDGTYMFTDEQRKRMRDDMDKAHLFALKTSFDDMLPYQKDSYMQLLDEDNVEVPVGLDEDKNIIKKNLRDIVSPESYEKFKDYAEKVYEKKQKMLKKDSTLSEEAADNIAREQQRNSELIGSVFDDINELKKEGKATERVLVNLELLDNIQNMGEDKLSEKDKKKYSKDGREDLISALKNDADTFDDAIYWESAMSTALQLLKNDGKIQSNAWSDDMSVVMIRDFYTMAKEAGLDLRATDSGSRESAKKLASKAITNTIERVSGGYDQRDQFNSIYLYGRKVSKQPINKKDGVYLNMDYIIDGGKKRYNETGIEVDL